MTRIEARSVFNQEAYDHTKENLFLGRSLNVARYDVVRYPFFEELTEKQHSFFWRPHEILLTQDTRSVSQLSPGALHLYLSNLKYQILQDSVNTRAPSIAFLPVASLPELEGWITAWSFFESIHSRSYTHIIRNITNNPSIQFDSIVQDQEIAARAKDLSGDYDHFINLQNKRAAGIYVSDFELKKSLLMSIISAYILEGIRFFVSFACSFGLAEQRLMEGSADIIRLIAQDEALHLTGAQYMYNLWRSGKDDPDMVDLINNKEVMEEIIDRFIKTLKQESNWAQYIFSEGVILGLNAKILIEYLMYIIWIRMNALGINPIVDKRPNPLPWMKNWLTNDNVQPPPQETAITSYLVGQVDTSLDDSDFQDFM